jgi:hypothetical protein
MSEGEVMPDLATFPEPAAWLAPCSVVGAFSPTPATPVRVEPKVGRHRRLVRITATISNTGNAAAGPCHTVFMDGSLPSARSQRPRSSRGSSVDVSIEWKPRRAARGRIVCIPLLSPPIRTMVYRRARNRQHNTGDLRTLRANEASRSVA